MKRKIITIDKDKCNGCGVCATACHEGAITIVDGKAELLREDFCDGFGDCLPTCPTGAITFEERDAQEYNEEAVRREKLKKFLSQNPTSCPSVQQKTFDNDDENVTTNTHVVSRLRQWPVQIKLAPTKADHYDGARLLIAADCTAYAYANMHEEFMKGRITLIGCPKLDMVDYSQKLAEIITNNDIKSLTIVRMEVPCCGGIQRACENALKSSGKFIPWQVVVISCDGRIIER